MNEGMRVIGLGRGGGCGSASENSPRQMVLSQDFFRSALLEEGSRRPHIAMLSFISV